MKNPGKHENNRITGSGTPVEQQPVPATDHAHLPAEEAASPKHTQTETRKTSRVNRLLIKGCLVLTGLFWTSALIVVMIVLGAFNPRPSKIKVVNDSYPSACTEIGTRWISPVDGMTLVCVPAGDFLMGSTNGDADGYDDEKPQHTVYLDAYWIDQTEVTNAQYAQCAAAGACRVPEATGSYTRNIWDGNSEHFGYPIIYYGNSEYADYPVIGVSWDDAVDYCTWAGRQLPSEAEWEKAARGTSGQIYPWGNQLVNADLLNYDRNVGDTTAVGTYPAGASPYGALDMAGNVWEWTSDWYGGGYYSSQTTWRNPAGPHFGIFRVIRGGSWLDDSRSVRVAFRFRGIPGDLGEPLVGFRCHFSAAP